MVARIIPAHLDEFDKAEWRDVCRELCPEWTDDEFEEAWAGFVAFKQRKRMQ